MEEGIPVSAARSLSTVAPIIFCLTVLSALASILGSWPHQFGGHGDRAHVFQEFITTGTATAPPLPILVVFGVIAWALRRRDWYGTVATVLLIPLAVLMAVGSLGEGFASSTPDVPRAIQLAGGTLGGAAAIVLLALAVMSLGARRSPGTKPKPR